MRFLLVAFLLCSVTAVHHQGKKHRSHHKHSHDSKHHAKKHHGEKHHAASYAEMTSKLEEMVQNNAVAEAEIGDASRRLEEALLDEALLEAPEAAEPAKAAAPVVALRGAPKKEEKKKLSANFTASLNIQKDNLAKLFSHLKSNIGDFNKREADQKKDASAYADRLKKRLAEDKKKLADTTLSEFDHEMLVNRTRTEEHELKFWTRGRELQHDMFHSNLKLTHGLMSRVQSVMEAYKQVLATGKLDPKLSKALHETSASLPKALIQKEERVNKDVRKIEKHLHIATNLMQ